MNFSQESGDSRNKYINYSVSFPEMVTKMLSIRDFCYDETSIFLYLSRIPLFEIAAIDSFRSSQRTQGQASVMVTHSAAALAVWSRQVSTRYYTFGQINWEIKAAVSGKKKKSKYHYYHNGPNRFFNTHIKTQICIHKKRFCPI